MDRSGFESCAGHHTRMFGGRSRGFFPCLEPEVMGLLALMLLQESRRAARTSPTG